jgi:hypothetical protein
MTSRISNDCGFPRHPNSNSLYYLMSYQFRSQQSPSSPQQRLEHTHRVLRLALESIGPALQDDFETDIDTVDPNPPLPRGTPNAGTQNAD